MSPLKKKGMPERPVATVALRAASDDHEPIASPAHDLQRALHDAGYHSEPFRPRQMSNAMLVLTLICVYALSMLMLLGSVGA
jgi:hypothetical protein